MAPACLALALVTASSVACLKARAHHRGRAMEPWAHWESFSAHFISPDGRVIDQTDGARTTSEGQAYALFFALVANDREQFDWLLSWTQDNLAQGDLRTHLPGWLWGENHGDWHLLDVNAAADADLWMIYTLLEASRLWHEPSYRRLAARMAQQVIDTEVDEIPGLGPMLVPGPEGFRLDETTWRLNPSYLPIPVIRRLAGAFPRGPWTQMVASTVALLEQSSNAGFLPDWVAYRVGDGFVDDPVAGSIGGYDAIRTYLWAGLTPEGDPASQRVAASVTGMVEHWRTTGVVPEFVESGQPRPGQGPPGFIGVLLPAASDRADELARLRVQLESHRQGDLYGSPPAYYDQVLLLFALGSVDGRYRFAADGRLEPRWGRRWRSP